MILEALDLKDGVCGSGITCLSPARLRDSSRPCSSSAPGRSARPPWPDVRALRPVGFRSASSDSPRLRVAGRASWDPGTRPPHGGRGGSWFPQATLDRGVAAWRVSRRSARRLPSVVGFLSAGVPGAGSPPAGHLGPAVVSAAAADDAGPRAGRHPERVGVRRRPRRQLSHGQSTPRHPGTDVPASAPAALTSTT